MFYLTEYQQGHRERQLWVASNPNHKDTMNEADKDLEQSIVRRKRGDIREDGMVFWCHHPKCKNKEHWVTHDHFISSKIKTCEAFRKYRAKNLEKRRMISREWARKNRDRMNISKMRSYYNNKLAHRITCSIKRSFKKNGYTKRSKTYEILGCSFDFLKKHLEIQFKDGMSWENRSAWHIDHIVPISSAKSEAEIISLNHYSNLQPLWAKDNIQKSNRMPNQETRDR